MFVTGKGNRCAQQVAVSVNGIDHAAEHGEEHEVLFRCFAGVEQVVALVIGERPVEVLSASIDSRERFFVKKADKTMPLRDFLHDIHKKLIVIGGKIRPFENGGEFILMRRHFVMTGGDRNTELVRLFADFDHEVEHPFLDGTEILILKLLSFRRRCAGKRTAGQNKVATDTVVRFVDQKIFLLGTAGRVDAFHVFMTEKFEQFGCSFADCDITAQQRQFLVERFAGVGDENRGNAEGFSVFDFGDERR